jgi:regulator of sigma E protease
LQAGDLIEKVDGAYFDNAEAMSNLLLSSGGPVTLTAQRLDTSGSFDITYAPVSGTLTNYVFVSGIAPESPAEAAGLLPDDVITAFNGERFTAFEDLPERTQAHLGEQITLTVLRDGTEREISLVPRVNPPDGEGSIGIGIVPAYENLTNGVIFVEGGLQQALVPLTLSESVQYSLERVTLFLDTLVRLPGEIIGGHLSSDETRLMSPIAISQFGAIFLQQSIEQNQPVVILNYIAIISIALGITNLLPLPALDGGRIVFVVLEIIRGRPIAPEREGIVHLIGMALLLSLMALAFLNDIFNPISTNLLP